MDISSEDEEGEINKDQQLEERVRNVFDKPVEADPLTLDDVKKVLITRETILKYCDMPWFEDYIKGSAFYLPAFRFPNLLQVVSCGILFPWMANRPRTGSVKS